YNLITNDKESEYEIVAFVDDNFKKAGSEIQGVPVMLPSKVMRESYIRRHKIEVLIIAIPSLGVEVKNKLAEQALALNLKVKIIPHVYELIEGRMKSEQIKDIQIEDLLGRDPIVLENEAIASELSGKSVLVTGAAGSIGSEIARQVMNYEPSKLVLLDMGESPVYDIQFELLGKYPDCRDRLFFEVADVRDAVRMEEIFNRYRPEVVFHAAAYKHVPLMEESPYEAVRTNVFGTRLVADLAIRYHVRKMVMISTDKAVNPTNVMGATKRIAEIYVQSRRSETQFVTTRFGNVLGSNGSVVPLFKKQLEKGGPLTVTDKRITRYFMTIPEACNLVLQAATIANGGEIFVFDMGKPVRIYDLACKIIRLSGR
ncbi:MAG: polysaccharide biosynthesis protein, partial [Bacteroidales bacterium]|nr:polysaccharide biosynthesis protein [Bacteroidales bacterium]